MDTKLQIENRQLRINLAMHETPILAVIDGWPECQEAIELVQKAGIDVKIVKVGIDITGEGMTPPYLVCVCPGGSGIERIRELVQRAVPFVHTGGAHKV